METIKARLAELAEINTRITCIDTVISGIVNEVTDTIKVCNTESSIAQGMVTTTLYIQLGPHVFNQIRDAIDLIMHDEKNRLLAQAEQIINSQSQQS